MIRAIHLNSCTPYQQADISDCKKINFIYGSNGCGKTTISSFLAGAKDSRFASCTIDWESENHETICVYNRDFRRSNFKQTIPGIFTMGSSAIEDLREIERLKEERQLRKDEYESQKEALSKKKGDKDIRENQFKEEAWNQILKKNEAEFQKAFGGYRNSKQRFKQELIARINSPKGQICDRQALIARASTLYSSKPEHCSRFNIDIHSWLDKIEEIRSDELWKTVIVGNKDVDISALIDKLQNSSWVSQGRQFLRVDSKICPFCQRATITDEFRNSLEAFFGNEYEKRVQRMRTLLSNYTDAADHILKALEEPLRNQESVRIGKLDSDLFQMKKIILCQSFADHEAKIQEKLKEPGIRIAISDVTSNVNELLDFINKANINIDAHNKLVDERDTAIATLTDDVWATCIDNASGLIQTYRSDIINLDKAITGITNAVAIKEKKVKELETLIVQKSKSITSVQPTIDEINRSLRAYGFTNFSIEQAEEQENYYCIKRPDGTLATNTLSEGEETFLICNDRCQV